MPTRVGFQPGHRLLRSGPLAFGLRAGRYPRGRYGRSPPRPLRRGAQLSLQASLPGVSGVQLAPGGAQLAVQFTDTGGAVAQPGLQLSDRLLRTGALAIGAGGRVVGPPGLGEPVLAG